MDFPETPYTPATGLQRTGLQPIAGGRSPATILTLLSPGKFAAANFKNAKAFYEKLKKNSEKLKKN